jgi:hypothetical protein
MLTNIEDKASANKLADLTSEQKVITRQMFLCSRKPPEVVTLRDQLLGTYVVEYRFCHMTKVSRNNPEEFMALRD